MKDQIMRAFERKENTAIKNRRYGPMNDYERDTLKEDEGEERENARLRPLIEKLAEQNEKLIEVLFKIGDEIGDSQRRDVPIIRELLKQTHKANAAFLKDLAK